MREFPARPVRQQVAGRAVRNTLAGARPWKEPRTAALPPELAAFEGMADPALIEAAARRAEFIGVGIDEVLRCHKILPPDQIAAALADKLGLPLDPLNDDFRPHALEAACAGVLARAAPEEETVITVAPRSDGVRRLADAIAKEPQLARHLRLAAPERLAEHVRRICTQALSDEAIYGLYRRRRDLSALGYGTSQLRWFTIGFSAAVITAGILYPAQLLIAVEYFLAFCFIAWTLIRTLACVFPQRSLSGPRIPERHLPVYTIILPLHREAAVVAKLITAIQRLDYPREKLDVKLLLEEDDFETRAAVARLDLAAPFEIIAPPKDGPRTKPKALAAALPFARGSFVVVYDAEDEPEPDQLRKALAAFSEGPPELVCVQAKLAIDNVSDGWFSRHFTSEYAGQFDVLLPALARLGLPIPLGGTSNHFRVEALRETGGWDPFNVTEDADLGMRLARFGYRVGVIDSATWEEAPVGFGQWLRQRTRWFKGWMQTWIVHMRHPLRLRRELGFRGFMALQLLVGGTVLSAVVHPIFMAVVANDILAGEFFALGDTFEESFRKVLAVAVLIVGYVGSGALGLVGLARRRMLGIAWILPTIPVYWMLLSLAAWRALYQLVRRPYEWEKTPHGLARSSLRGGHRRSKASVHPRRRRP